MNHYFSLVDWKFINLHESSSDKPILIGYVPLGKGKKNYTGNEEPPKVWTGSENSSGVTICHGFDLGQHDPDFIRTLPVSSNVIDQLCKFSKLKRLDACNALFKDKCIISEGVANSIDEYVKTHKARVFIDNYNNMRNKEKTVSFEQINPFVRTALVDFSFQYGESCKWKTVQDGGKYQLASKYWELIITQDWLKARQFLETQYNGTEKKRRDDEANLYKLAGIRYNVENNDLTPIQTDDFYKKIIVNYKSVLYRIA